MDTTNKPFFSVVIITYNRPDKLIEAIDSVLAQEFHDFELIIVNDGSALSYDSVLKHIEGNSRVRYFYKENEERSIARNYGIDKANGTWICFLDDDDIYYPEHLTVRYSAIQEAKTTNIFYYSPCVHRLPDGSTQKEIITEYNGVDILVYSGFHISTVCLPATIAKKYKFNSELTYYEDFEYWLHIFIDEKPLTKLINVCSTEYVFHDNNTVNNWSSKLFYNKLKTFNFLRTNYSGFLPKWYLRDKFFMIYIGLADCLAIENKRGQSLVYLLKAITCKRNLKGLTQILGALRKIINIV